jgi:hypothetical protein
MRRLWAAGAVMLMCAALLIGLTGGALLAASPSPMPAGVDSTFVTGTEECTFGLGTATEDIGGVEHYRDATATCTHEASDPRVTGLATYTWGGDFWPSGGVQWGAGSIANEGGTWEGTWSGVLVSEEAGGDVITFWLKGTGDYEGLSYYYRTSGRGPWDVIGLIFPGDPPVPAIVEDAPGQ